MRRPRRWLACCDNNIHVELDELGGGRRQPLISAACAATVDDDAGSRDISEISKAALQREVSQFGQKSSQPICGTFDTGWPDAEPPRKSVSSRTFDQRPIRPWPRRASNRNSIGRRVCDAERPSDLDIDHPELWSPLLLSGQRISVPEAESGPRSYSIQLPEPRKKARGTSFSPSRRAGHPGDRTPEQRIAHNSNSATALAKHTAHENAPRRTGAANSVAPPERPRRQGRRADLSSSRRPKPPGSARFAATSTDCSAPTCRSRKPARARRSRPSRSRSTIR